MTHVHTSPFPLKTNATNLKTEIDQLDIHQLVPVSVYLSKLIDTVKNFLFI